MTTVMLSELKAIVDKAMEREDSEVVVLADEVDKECELNLEESGLDHGLFKFVLVVTNHGLALPCNEYHSDRRCPVYLIENIKDILKKGEANE